MTWQKVIALGDSNTQFGWSSQWLALLSDMMQRRCEVINRGFSGYSTDHIVRILPQIMAEFSVDSTFAVLVMLGSNDCTLSSNALQHVPIDRYKLNLARIVQYLSSDWALPKERIIFITPPPIDDAAWGSFVLTAYGDKAPTHRDASAGLYAQACVETAKSSSISCINIYEAMKREGEETYKKYLIDGLHLSKEGGQLLYENIRALISERVERELKGNFPDWKTLPIDRSQPIIQ